MSAQLGDFLALEPREPTKKELFEELNHQYDRINNSLQPGNEGLLETLGDAFAAITEVFKKIAVKILPDFLLLMRNSEIQANAVVRKAKGIDAYYTPANFKKFVKTLFPVVPGFKGDLLAAHTAIGESTKVIQEKLIVHLKEIKTELSRIATHPDAEKAIVNAMGSSKAIEETIERMGAPHVDFIDVKGNFDRMVGSKLYGNFKQIEEAGKVINTTGVIFTTRDADKIEQLIREIDDISSVVISRIKNGNVVVSKRAIKELAKMIKNTADLLETVSAITYFNVACIGTTKEVITWITKKLKKT